MLIIARCICVIFELSVLREKWIRSTKWWFIYVIFYVCVHMAGYDYGTGFSNNRRTTRKMLFLPSQVLARLLADFAIMREKKCFWLVLCVFIYILVGSRKKNDGFLQVWSHSCTHLYNCTHSVLLVSVWLFSAISILVIATKVMIS